jgi:hypothetical protein
MLGSPSPQMRPRTKNVSGRGTACVTLEKAFAYARWSVFVRSDFRLAWTLAHLAGNLIRACVYKPKVVTVKSTPVDHAYGRCLLSLALVLSVSLRGIFLTLIPSCHSAPKRMWRVRS